MQEIIGSWGINKRGESTRWITANATASLAEERPERWLPSQRQNLQKTPASGSISYSISIGLQFLRPSLR